MKKRNVIASLFSLTVIVTVMTVSIPAVMLSCEAETAGRSIRFQTAAKGAVDFGASLTDFENAKGWRIELTRALALLGPIYFYGGEPMASRRVVVPGAGVAAACPTHAQYDYGAVLGEVLEQYVVDLLAEKPTPTGEIYAFADGWELGFDKYIVAVGKVRFEEQDDGAEVETWAGPKVMDLAAGATGSEALVDIEGLPARRLDVGFSFVAPKKLPDVSTASSDDVQLMIDNGWSLLVEGEANHPESGRTVRFRLGLPVASRYFECINGKDTTRGIAVEASKTTGAYIYAHAIHLFWDTLASGDEDLRFEAFAAMAGDDDLVTEEALKAQDLTDLRDANGDPLVDAEGCAVVYNDGGLLPPGEWTLYHFVQYATLASAHFNGIGLCKSESLE